MTDKAWTQKMAEQGIRLLPQAQYAPEAFSKSRLLMADRALLRRARDRLPAMPSMPGIWEPAHSSALPCSVRS